MFHNQYDRISSTCFKNKCSITMILIIYSLSVILGLQFWKSLFNEKLLGVALALTSVFTVYTSGLKLAFIVPTL